MKHQATTGAVNVWGNSLALRLSKVIASTAGMEAGTPVRITAQRGRLIIEAEEQEPSLSDMLRAYDPTRHAGEAMAFSPIGKEIL